MEDVINLLKEEQPKMIKLIKENGEGLYGENCQFKTLEEYTQAVGHLVNVSATIEQYEKIIKAQKAQEEAAQRMQEEAKKAQ